MLLPWIVWFEIIGCLLINLMVGMYYRRSGIQSDGNPSKACRDACYVAMAHPQTEFWLCEEIARGVTA
jgi:hypothetical protein